MIPLPKSTATPKPLHDMLNGAIHARILQAAIEIAVFDCLASFRSAGEVASELDTNEQNTSFFLDALTTIGLLTKKDGRYQNSSLVQEYLVSSSPLFLGPLFYMIQGMSIDSLDQIEEYVKKGPLPQEPREDLSSQSTWTGGARAGAAWAFGEVGSRAAMIAKTLPGFEKFDSMLDLGGGHGLFALYMAQASKKLKVVVFDQPAVVEVAEEFIDAYGMADQVSTRAGDYIKDDFGKEYDLIWASATLSFAKNDMDRLVTKIHFALKPKGYFISLHDGMTHERTQPDTNLGWLGGLLSTGMDYRFEQGEIAESMLRCGFRSVRSKTVNTPMGALDLDIAWKGNM